MHTQILKICSETSTQSIIIKIRLNLWDEEIFLRF